MAKVKNKKQNSSDTVRSKKNLVHKIKHNPFDMHVNKQKFSVLGQKSKNDKGLPGISRSKALNKRKNTLLPQFQLKNKANKFLDRRIGEKNKSLTTEDKITARFTAERVKMHKKSIFNLGDDEILTHRGQTLTEIEKFDDPRSEDEFSDDGKQTGGLAADFVSDAHFGGGILSNTGREGTKSRKDLIEQLIVESKKRKAEKQKLREQTIELTEKLDSEWKDLLPLVSTRKKDDLAENVKNDEYDKVMQELRFEARGQPTDRLKTEDEVAKEEKERLERLEKDRLMRMKGFVDESENKSKHRSADDLDDNFVYETDMEPILVYGDDGLLIGVEAGIEINNTKHEKKMSVGSEKQDYKCRENDCDENGENECEESSETESDNLSDLKADDSDCSDDDNEEQSLEKHIDDFSDIAESLNVKKSIQDNKTISSSKNKDISENLNDFSSLKASSYSIQKKTNERKGNEILKNDENPSLLQKIETLLNNPEKKTKLDKKKKNNLKTNFLDTEEITERNLIVSDIQKVPNSLFKEESSENNATKRIVVHESEETIGKNIKEIIDVESECEKEKFNRIKTDLLKRKKMMEQAREELPYTYDVPEKYEGLQKLLAEQSPDHQSVILERMIKCNHVSLSELNKEKLSTLFTYLMQYVNDVAMDGEEQNDITSCYRIFDSLIPHIYDLAQMDKENAHNCILEILKEKQNDYRKNYKQFPGSDTLIFLKLVTFIFPTSDFRHQVVTPALVFIGQMLTKCSIKSRRDITTGLFLITLVLEYTYLSKRFFPPVINFLRGLLYMSVFKPLVSTIKVIPPFKTIRSLNSMLVLNAPYSIKTDLIMKSSDFIMTKIDNDFKVRALWCVLRLCSEFYANLEVLDSSYEIFEPIFDLLQRINGNYYPKEVQRELEKIILLITDSKKKKKLEFLTFEKKKPKALRLYEPNIQKVFDTKKHRVTSKEKAEREKLIHKYKKEMKGALREIRKDNAFLTKLKINKQIESDIERKRKVKEIYSSASIQQSELNAMDRKKKKK